MKITQEELIEMICEGVNKKISSLISESRKKTLTESNMIRMVEQAIFEYMFTDDGSVFGSDRFDYDAEYDAIDYDTLQDVLGSGGWFFTDVHILTSPTGQKAVRFELDFGANCTKNIREIYNDIKTRAMYPDGIRLLKTKDGHPVLVVYRYKND